MSDPSIVRFRAVVEAALAALEARREEVNDLNVFPVADGDTGDNMVLTLRAVLQELDRLSSASEQRSIDDIGREEIVGSVARAALLGARGNSGVILSQLIRGAAEELASRPGELVDPVLISAALARASDQAYGSVRQPAEGTILTVVLAGIVGALKGSAPPPIEHQKAARVTHPQHESSTYRYCTNFAITGSGLSSRDYVNALEQIGDSVLVVGDPTTLKVHVHTDDPDAATALFDGAGMISHLDVADMREQVERRDERVTATLAVCGALAVTSGIGMRPLFEGPG